MVIYWCINWFKTWRRKIVFKEFNEAPPYMTGGL